MKRPVVVFGLAFLLFPLLAMSTPRSATKATPEELAVEQAAARRKRIAVLDFDYGTVRTSVAAIFGSDIDVGQGITDMLITHLVNDGTYSIIERERLDTVLGEQNFSNSDRANANSAAQLCRILGVDAIIVGTITQFGNETESTGLGGVGRALGRFGFGGVDQSETSAIVGIDARIINIETAEILVAATGRGESSRKSTSMIGGGGSWEGSGAGRVNFGSADFQETILGEAIRLATDALGAELVDGDDRISVRQVSVEGLVAAVDGDILILNVGSNAGAQVGDEFAIERVTREITDPLTGAVIRRLSSEVGRVELIDVDGISSIGQIISGADFQVGDLAKTAN